MSNEANGQIESLWSVRGTTALLAVPCDCCGGDLVLLGSSDTARYGRCQECTDGGMSLVEMPVCEAMDRIVATCLCAQCREAFNA